MKIGDKVVYARNPMKRMRSGQVEMVVGKIVAKGLVGDWNVVWENGRDTDEFEIYPRGRFKGQPNLVPAYD